MKRQRAERHIVDTAVVPHSNADLFKSIGRTAEKLGTTVSNLAKEAQDKGDLAAMNESMSEANMQAMEFTQAWRVENEGKPRDPQATAKYNQGMRDIYAGHSDKISFQNKGKWSEVSSKLTGRSQENNLAWGYKQEVVNAETSINKSRENNLIVGAQLGAIGDIDKALEVYRDSRDGLIAFGQGIFSSERMTEILDDYEADYMEAVLGGMLETDPAKAKEFLNRKDVQEALRSPERKETLSDLADNKQTEMDDAQYEAQVNIESETSDMLFDPEISSVKKMASLSLREREGEVSEEYAELGRLLLKSKKAMKALPNTPEETELMVLSAMLKQQLGTNPSSKESKAFLRKKREFNDLVVKYQTAGTVTKKSAASILNGLNTSLSKATGGTAKSKGTWIIFDAADAYKMFKNDLGGSLYQGEAIREFFYATDGGNKSAEDMKSLAKSIVAQKKNQSLTQVTDSVEKKQKETPVYSQADLEYTAKKNKISVAEVKKRLRIK